MAVGVVDVVVVVSVVVVVVFVVVQQKSIESNRKKTGLAFASDFVHVCTRSFSVFGNDHGS